MSALFAGEIDLHNDNFGLDHRGRFVKIDGDWTLARLRYRIEGSWLANRNYNITPALIKSLPHLAVKDYQLHNYGHQVKQRKNTGEDIIPGIDPVIFRQEVNQALLKILLTPNDYLLNLAENEMTNADEERAMEVACIECINRKFQATISACEDPQFREYMQTDEAKAYAESFRDELATYKMTEKVSIANADNQQMIMAQFKELRQITQLNVKSNEWRKRLALHAEKNLELDDALVSPWQETPLHLAAASGNLNTVNILLANHADIHKETSANQTPIFYAARSGVLVIFTTLIQAGANAFAVGKDGYTPLILAAGNGHFDIVEFIVRHGGKVDQCIAPTNNTALTVAADQGHAKIVELLLKNNANPAQLNNQQHSALTLAAAKGHTETVKVILNHYASINANPDPTDLEFALLTTAKNGHVDTFNTILELAATIDNLRKKTADHPTPLILAAARGHSEIVQSILRLKPDAALLNATTHDGSTALLCAAKYKHWNIVSSLLNEKDIDVNEENNDFENVFELALQENRADICAKILEKNNNLATYRSIISLSSILHFAVKCANLDVVKDLITRQHLSIDMVNRSGVTPLQLAVMKGCTEIANFLLENNADIEHQDKNRMTALHLAVDNNNLAMVNLLIDHGARIDPENNKGIFIRALEDDHLEVLHLLLSRAGKLNMPIEDGMTLLHIAAHTADIRMLDNLLAAHVDIDPQDFEGNTPLLIAAAKGNLDIFTRLLAENANIDARNNDGETLTTMTIANPDIVNALRAHMQKQQDIRETAGEFNPNLFKKPADNSRYTETESGTATLRANGKTPK